MATELVTTIEFQANGQQVQNDFIRQGQRLTINCDPQRTTACRGYHDAMRRGTFFVNVRFTPSGETFSGPLVQHYNQETNSGIFDPPRPIPFTVNVPADSTQTEIWFLNRNTGMRISALHLSLMSFVTRLHSSSRHWMGYLQVQQSPDGGSRDPS